MIPFLVIFSIKRQCNEALGESELMLTMQDFCTIRALIATYERLAIYRWTFVPALWEKAKVLGKRLTNIEGAFRALFLVEEVLRNLSAGRSVSRYGILLQSCRPFDPGRRDTRE